MKKRVLIAIKGIENENLNEIKEVENAIEKIKSFARHSENLNKYQFVTENAEMQGENNNNNNNLYLSLNIEVEGLEDILGSIATLTAKLKIEIEKLDKAITMSIEKAPTIK